MEESSIVLIVTASISAFGAIVVERVFHRFKGWRAGLEKHKRREIDTLSSELDNISAQRDRIKTEKLRLSKALEGEIELRRKHAEHSSDLRRMLIEGCGIPASELPPWPSS